MSYHESYQDSFYYFLPFTPRSSKCLFLSDFPTNILYTSLFSLTCMLHAPFSFNFLSLDRPNNMYELFLEHTWSCPKNTPHHPTAH